MEHRLNDFLLLVFQLLDHFIEALFGVFLELEVLRLKSVKLFLVHLVLLHRHLVALDELLRCLTTDVHLDVPVDKLKLVLQSLHSVAKKLVLCECFDALLPFALVANLLQAADHGIVL